MGDGEERGDERRESEIKLRIVPAFAVEGEKRSCGVSLVDLSLEPTFTSVAYGYMATDDAATSSESDVFSVYRAMYPKKERKEVSKRDVLDVAYYSGVVASGVEERRGGAAGARWVGIPAGCGCPFYVSQERCRTMVDASYRLLLNYRGYNEKEEEVGNDEGMVRDVLTGYRPADTRVLTSVSFLHRGVLSPTSRYVFRGREYLCQKLEYTLTEDGVSELVKGYFYEVD